MKIYGTDTEDFTTFLKDGSFESGDILGTNPDEEILVLRKLPAEHFFAYEVQYPALIGEELENAIQHFKFLRKYRL